LSDSDSHNLPEKSSTTRNERNAKSTKEDGHKTEIPPTKDGMAQKIMFPCPRDMADSITRQYLECLPGFIRYFRP
jgi:hypothetical protein